MEICVVGINGLILTRAHYVCEYSVKHVTGNTSITLKVIFKIDLNETCTFYAIFFYSHLSKFLKKDMNIKKSKIIIKITIYLTLPLIFLKAQMK